MSDLARLVCSCSDQPGIVAAVSGFLYQRGANITVLDQHSSDPREGDFFMRLEFDLAGIASNQEALSREFGREVADRLGMNYRIGLASERPKAAILVSREDHALLELLWRWRRGELVADFELVISNHPDLEAVVQSLGLTFLYIPNNREIRPKAEAAMLKALADHDELLVLARYMQVLSPDFVARYPERIINIHHSFLPAFVGAHPYRQAWERGVKLIGATAHYVTADLDSGPIIEQDVARVSHRDGVEDLMTIGRDLERQVLARAVRWHLEDRVIVHGHRTVVFR